MFSGQQPRRHGLSEGKGLCGLLCAELRILPDQLGDAFKTLGQ